MTGKFERLFVVSVEANFKMTVFVQNQRTYEGQAKGSTCSYPNIALLREISQMKIGARRRVQNFCARRISDKLTPCRILRNLVYTTALVKNFNPMCAHCVTMSTTRARKRQQDDDDAKEKELKIKRLRLMTVDRVATELLDIQEHKDKMHSNRECPSSLSMDDSQTSIQSGRIYQK